MASEIAKLLIFEYKKASPPHSPSSPTKILPRGQTIRQHLYRLFIYLFVSVLANRLYLCRRIDFSAGETTDIRFYDALAGNEFVFQCHSAIKMFAKATAIFVPMAVPWKWSSSFH